MNKLSCINSPAVWSKVRILKRSSCIGCQMSTYNSVPSWVRYSPHGISASSAIYLPVEAGTQRQRRAMSVIITGQEAKGIIVDGKSITADDSDDEDEEEDEMVDMFIMGPGGMEWGGPTRGGKFPEPTRYGDWEQKGRCTDF